MKSLSLVLSATVVGSVMWAGYPAPAHAAPVHSTGVVVTYQDAGAGCTATNNTVVLVDPYAGTQIAAFGKPTGMTGTINEAKPIERNTKVVAVWGGNPSGPGGVGVFTRSGATGGSWAMPITFPNTFERATATTGNNPHSVAMLPDGSYAVAQTGTITGQSGSGFIVVFRPDGTISDYEPLASAHGVEYDPVDGVVYAIGYTKIHQYSVAPGALTFQKAYTLPPPSDPTKPAGGHDISRRRTDGKYLVTTNSSTFVFDPKATTTTAQFTTVTTNPGGTPLAPGVKSIDQQFDGSTVYMYYKSGSRFFFTDGTSKTGPACMAPYKARWIWAPGAELQREDLAATATPDPFLWYDSEVRAEKTTPTPIGDVIWAGYASYWDKTGVVNAIKSQIGAGNIDGGTGKVPYIMFYHWGDGNDPDEEGPDVPTMSQAQNGTTAQYDAWVDFADAIARAIGPNRAYVVLESEWDVNGATSACSTKFLAGMHRVIDKFELLSKKATLINSPGLWKSKSDYTCFTPASRYDVHGFPLHIVSNTTHCATQGDGGKFGGLTLAEARDLVNRTRAKAALSKEYFGQGNTIITDLAITSCEWGQTEQAALFQRLVDAIPTLYGEIGLRGVGEIRTGAPQMQDREMGNYNEQGFVWGTETRNVINGAPAAIKTFLDSMQSGQPTEDPTFTANATVTPHANPGGSVTVSSTFTCTKVGTNDVIVDLEIWGPSGTKVDGHFQTGQAFRASESRQYPWTWTVPLTAASGTYTVKLGVFTPGWSRNLYWKESAATFTVDGSSPPSFTATASSTPSSVGTGGSSQLSATVTNNGSALSGGQVDVEVYNPSGTRTDRVSYTNESIAAGASKTFTIPWVAPQTAGTYTIRVAVYGAGGSPYYGGNPSAGTITVTNARFTSSVTTSTATVAPGGTTTVTATITNVGSVALTDGDVSVEVYDSANERVAQQTWSAQSIAAGASATYPYTWTASTTPGTYRVKVGVFGAGWTPTLHWNDDAARIGVANPTFETGASATPSTVAPGGTTTITVTVTSTGGTLANGVVDLEIYNAAGTRVTQQGWTGQNIASGSTRSYTYTWTAPSTTGTYTAKVGVMGPGWTPTYEWNNAADSIVVAAPSFRSTATVAASTVSSGASTTIDAAWTATGGAVTNARFQIAVDFPDGSRHVDDDWVAALADGATYTKSYTWTAPSTPSGTYRVRLGVFSNSWGSTYHWNGTAATIGVGSTAFQPTFTVGDGANNWWIEVYTSSDVTAVDAIGKDGAFYLPLVKRSWGAWAATAPTSVASGDLVRFVARRLTDGASAGSSNFAWLTGSPTTDPGWACTFTRGAGSSSTWVEVYTSSAATGVEVKVGSGAFTALTKQAVTGAWAKAMNVSAGTKVIFRATRADGARSYSTVYNWLQ